MDAITVGTICGICGLPLSAGELDPITNQPATDVDVLLDDHIAAEHPSFVPASSGLELKP